MAEPQKGTITYQDQFGTRRPDKVTKEQSLVLLRTFLRYASGRALRHEHMPHKHEGIGGFKVGTVAPGSVYSISFEGPVEDVLPASLLAKVMTGTEHADAAFIEACRLYNDY